MERRISREGLLGAGRNLARGLWLVAAVIFVAAFTTSVVSERTSRLDGLDLAIGQVELLKLESSLAVIAADDLRAGRTEVEVSEAAVGRLRETTGLLGRSLVASDRTGAEPLRSAVESLVAALESGEVAEAGRIVETRVVPEADALGAVLAAQRAELLAELETISSMTGAGAVGAGAVVVLFVPVALIVAIRSMARRQVQRTEREVRDEASRELSNSQDQFIAGLSHELRTPLTAVLGFAQILEDFDGTVEESIEIAQAIGQQGSELARMVEDLLVAARLDVELAAFRIEAVSARDVVDQTLGMTPDNNSLTIDVEDARMLADAARLRHVLRNLISNARSHGRAPFRIEGRSGHGVYVITVADRGAGLEVDVEAMMSRRFVHEGAQPLTTGSVGLGLHVAAALAAGMGGTLRHQRVEGWTLFEVELPLVTQPVLSGVAIDA